MEEFFETIPGKPHTTLHTRVWEHPGAIVDLGCLDWDWCNIFLGKKRVIGVDPNLTMSIHGAELISAQIGPCNGIVSFQGGTNWLVNSPGVPQEPMQTWKRFVQNNIGSEGVAALKINIEGSEWSLLASMSEADFAGIDQIAVSFHHFVPAWSDMEKFSKAIIGYLSDVGYNSREIYAPYCWWLFWKKN